MSDVVIFENAIVEVYLIFANGSFAGRNRPARPNRFLACYKFGNDLKLDDAIKGFKFLSAHIHFEKIVSCITHAVCVMCCL